MKKILSAFLAFTVALSGVCFADEPTNQNKIVWCKNGNKLVYVSNNNIAPFVKHLESRYEKYQNQYIGEVGKICIPVAAAAIGLVAFAATAGALHKKIDNLPTAKKVAAALSLTALGTVEIIGCAAGGSCATHHHNKKIDKKLDALKLNFGGLGGNGTVTCRTRIDIWKQATGCKHDEVENWYKRTFGAREHRCVVEREDGIFNGLVKTLKRISPDQEHRAICGKFDDKYDEIYLPAYTDEGKGIIIFFEKIEQGSGYYYNARIFRQGNPTILPKEGERWDLERYPLVTSGKRIFLEALSNEYKKRMGDVERIELIEDNNRAPEKLIDKSFGLENLN